MLQDKKLPRYTDIVNREKILELHDAGYKQREIAKYVNVSPSTVNLWINRLGNVESYKRTGRKRKTTKIDDNNIYATSTQNPFLPATYINKQLSLNVSAQTIRNRLMEQGLQNYKAPQKTELKEHHKNKRLEFAYRYMHWSADKWESVCFADEKVFQSFGLSHFRVWRPRLSRWKKNPSQNITRFHESVIATNKYSGRFSISVWGCIGKINHLHVIKVKHLNAIYFRRNILNKYIPKNEEDFILVHDNSPIHTAIIIKEWLERNNITVLEWPAYSPDLNPIENLWSRLEYLTQDRKPSSKEELWDIIKDTYDRIIENDSYIKKLVRSMPNRLQDVIKAEGNVTKY